MSRYFIGIDSGTQSTKALVVDGENGTVLGSGSGPHGLIEERPGQKEQDPEDWMKALSGALEKALSSSGIDRSAVGGIGVSGQQHGFVALNSSDRVIRPAKLWCDTETAPQCEKLIDRLGGLDAVVAEIGNGIPPGFTAGKLPWLREREPESYRSLATILLPHNYINFCLTGEKTMEDGDASGTAFYDVRRRRWSKKVLAAIDPDRDLAACLPPLVAADAPAGRLRAEIASRFGLPVGLPVSSGGGDNMMAAIGTGNVSPGIVTASLGTSGTIFAYSSEPVVDEKGELAAFCDSTGAWLPLVCVMNVTVATEYARRAFGLSTEELNTRASSVAEGADGLLLLPYFSGERTPNVPEGCGVLFGLDGKTFSPAHAARAAMEGATLSMNYGLEIMRRKGIDPKEIRVAGGGAKSALWRRICADVFRAEVVPPVEEEAAALGGAIQAAWCAAKDAGHPEPITKICERMVRLEESARAAPGEPGLSRYRELYAMQCELSTSLRELFRRRNAYLRDTGGTT